jgi:uncharacterized membrane protein
VGLFTGLLTLPLAPVRGVAWIAEVVAEEADRELAAAASPERALADLEAALAAGEIDEEEFEHRRLDLMDEIIASRTEAP